MEFTKYDSGRVMVMELEYILGVMLGCKEYIVPDYKNIRDFCDRYRNFFMSYIDDDDSYEVTSTKKLYWAITNYKSLDDNNTLLNALLEFLDSVDCLAAYWGDLYTKPNPQEEKIISMTKLKLHGRIERYIERRMSIIDHFQPDNTKSNVFCMFILSIVKKIIASYVKVLDMAEKNEAIQDTKHFNFIESVNRVDFCNKAYDYMDMSLKPYSNFIAKNRKRFEDYESRDKCRYYLYPSDEKLDDWDKTFMQQCIDEEGY